MSGAAISVFDTLNVAGVALPAAVNIVIWPVGFGMAGVAVTLDVACIVVAPAPVP